MKMRVCIEKATGKLIEMQSGNAELGALKQNAVNAGYMEVAIEEKHVTDAEFQVIMEAQPKPPTAPDPDEELAAAITAATTLDQLKNALLGKLGKSAKVKGKPV
jgi:hypothetical protein